MGPGDDRAHPQVALGFDTGMKATLVNRYIGHFRRLAGQIDLDLADGSTITGWRTGYRNIDAGSNFIQS